MILTSPRLYVRYLREDDFDAMSAIHPVSRDRHNQFVSNPSKTCMAVCKTIDDSFVGRCGFRTVEDRVELEIFFIPTERDHGYGSELLVAMISHATTAFQNLIVAATVSPSNSHMIHLLTTHGFENSGETVHMKAGLQHLYKRIS